MMWNEVMAIPALILCLWALRGIASILWESHEPPLRHLAWAAALLIVAILGRGVFWDLGGAVFGEGWRDFARQIGGIEINALFYVPVIVAVWHFGKVLQFLIPDDEQHKWPLWKVPFYPYGLCLYRLSVVRWSRRGGGK